MLIPHPFLDPASHAPPAARRGDAEARCGPRSARRRISRSPLPRPLWERKLGADLGLLGVASHAPPSSPLVGEEGGWGEGEGEELLCTHHPVTMS